MKKINNIEQLREVLRNIILTQDPEEIKNFNSLYDYSNITDMSNLWEEHLIKLFKNKVIDWKNIKFPTLDMINVTSRNEIFKNCSLYEINLINTYNIKNLNGGFEECENLEKISLDLKLCEEREYLFYISGIKEVKLLNTQNIKKFSHRFYRTKNLEKLNTLYLDNCEKINNCFEETNIKESELYNTGKVKNWNESFRKSNIEEISLDMKSCETREYMFREDKNLKKINLKNCENIKSIKGFIQGCENLEYLEMNISNMKNIRNFIDKKNNLEYLKIIGIEDKKFRKKEMKEKFNELFFDEEHEINPIPHIELVKNNTTFNIIGDNNSNIRLEKKKEKEKKCEIKKEKIKKKEGKLKSKKEYNLEINL